MSAPPFPCGGRILAEQTIVVIQKRREVDIVSHCEPEDQGGARMNEGLGVEAIVRLIKRILLLLVLAMAAVYGADYLVARSRPLGSVQVQPYYAVPQKDGKIEFIMLDPEVDSCVNSLLPHLGQQPCWYLNRRKQKRIDM